MNSETIFELAMNKVKPGQLEAFKSAREAFILEMKKEEGIGPDGTFQSFFTMPGELDSEVYVGITEWTSMQAFQQACQNLMPTPAFGNYFATFDQLAYLQLKPQDGGEFNINDLLKEGQVIEFAVRYPRSEAAEQFPQKRADLFQRIAQQEGYLFDREFVSIQGDKQVVIIVWDSQENFQKALQTLSQCQEMMDLMSIVVVDAYQATQKVG